MQVGVHGLTHKLAGYRDSVPCILQPGALAKDTRVEQAHQLFEAVIHTQLMHPPCHPHNPWQAMKQPAGETMRTRGYLNGDISLTVQLCAFARLGCREANLQKSGPAPTIHTKGRTDRAQTLPSSTLSAMTAGGHEHMVVSASQIDRLSTQPQWATVSADHQAASNNDESDHVPVTALSTSRGPEIVGNKHG